MSAAEKNEGATPWRESAPITKNENLYPSNILSSAKTDNLEVAPLKTNAFMIIPDKGASRVLWALKDDLRRLGCRYSKTVPHKGWIFPRMSKEGVATFLGLKKVGVSFKEINDGYQNKSWDEKESDDLWGEIECREERYQAEEELIVVGEQNLENEIAVRGLKEDEPGVKEERKRLEDRRKKHSEMRAEIDQLRNTVGIVEEKATHKDVEEWIDPFPLQEKLRPVAPFLEEMLPDILRAWIMDNAERMQVPPDFLAATSVVVLGSLIGRKIGIYPKAQDDWLVIPNLWGAIVGRPSLLKSPAIAEIMKPLDKLASKAIDIHKAAIQDHEHKKSWQEAQKSAQKDEMKKAARKKQYGIEIPYFVQIQSIDEPILKRYKTEDGTVEKIGEILLENPQGILIHRDELIGWLKGLDKYGREGDRAFFLESWAGNGTYTVDRIGRGTLHIPALCLSIIGGIQPGPLAEYVHQAATGGSGDDGLLQRFQLLVWPDALKSWKNIDRMPNVTAREQVSEVFRRIDAFAPFEPSSNGVNETYRLRFAPDAQCVFDEWRTDLEQMLCNEGISPALESHLAKYRSLMPSLALIFYLIETVGRGVIAVAVDVESVRWAIMVVQLFRDSCKTALRIWRRSCYGICKSSFESN